MKNDPILENLFRAYFDVRKKKRNKISSLNFEINFEHEIFKLYNEIKEKRYILKPSICFINEHPVKREVFAANFRDRVVQHLVFNYINPVFERIFINDSYSCRKNKGTLYGIKRLDYFMRSCSENYKKDCYILQLDIKGYFMSIDKIILYRKVENTLAKNRELIKDIDLNLLLYLIRKIIFDDPVKNCITKSDKRKWNNLPKDKSLFYNKEGIGLPIGNLTSQLFSNVYLDEFDYYIKDKLDCKCYGRYADDFFIVSKDKNFLKKIIKKISIFLQKNLNIKIHPRKIYLQYYTKGANFLGAYIKPFRVYIRNRIKGRLYEVVNNWNRYLEKVKSKLSKEDVLNFVNTVNSYFGMMKHLKAGKLRVQILRKMSLYTFNFVYVSSSQYCVIQDRFE